MKVYIATVHYMSYNCDYFHVWILNITTLFTQVHETEIKCNMLFTYITINRYSYVLDK